VNPKGLTNMPGGAVCPGHGDALATTCCFDEDRSQPVREAGLMNGPGAGVLELGEPDEENSSAKRRRAEFAPLSAHDCRDGELDHQGSKSSPGETGDDAERYRPRAGALGALKSTDRRICRRRCDAFVISASCR
jgi:hypothetical protein